jgi:glycine oxidase
MANTADVLVLGGGAVGLACAHRLAMSELEVAVLDRAAEGSASTAAAGMLATPLEMSEGEAFFELCLQSRRLYPELVQLLRERTDIDVEYLPWGTLQLLPDEAARSRWTKRVEELRKRDLGVEILDAAELRTLEPQLGDFPCGAVLLSEDHHLNNEELVRALGQACDKLGVRRFQGVVAHRLLRKGDHVLGADSSGGTFTAAETLLAAGAWSASLLQSAGLSLPLQPIRGQMLALRADLVARHVLYDGDLYLVPRLTGELLIGSSLEEAGFRVANTVEAIGRLAGAAMRFSSALGTAEISRLWSGLRPRTPDGLPALGRYSGVKGLLVATGHYRNGILLTPVTARLIAELILEGSTALELGPFAPDRFSR